MKTILVAAFLLLIASACSGQCPDLNGEGLVNTGDLGIFLDEFGETGDDLASDFSEDGLVGTLDLTFMLSLFGEEVKMEAETSNAGSIVYTPPSGNYTKKIIFQNVTLYSNLCETYSPWFSPGDSIPDTVRAQFSASEDVEIIAIGLISPLASGEQYNGWYWTNYSTLLRECNIIIDVIAPPGQHTVTVNALPWANTVEQLQNGEYQFTEINLSRPFTVE